MADKIKSIAVDEARKIRREAGEGIRSGTYFYPFHGIIYFLTHRSLWKPLRSRLLPTLTLGAGVTSALFFFTYVPQMAVLALTSGPFLAPISAALLVLSESAALTTALARYLFRLDAAQLDVFDATLICKGQESLVADGRLLLRAGSGGNNDDDPMSKLGRVIGKMPLKGGWLSLMTDLPSSLVRWLLYLPLNFVPVVGSVVFVTMQGRKTGPALHERYFQLKRWGVKERGEWVEGNRARYTSFGVAAFALEMIPLASLVFSFTNTVGAALWAADIETRLQAKKKS